MDTNQISAKQPTGNRDVSLRAVVVLQALSFDKRVAIIGDGGISGDLENDGGIDAGGKLAIDRRGGDGELGHEARGAPENDINIGSVDHVCIQSTHGQAALAVQHEIVQLGLNQIIGRKAGDIQLARKIVQDEGAVL